MQDDRDEDWFPEDIFEAFKELRKRRVFDVSDMYTIADVWGWTWERELKNRPPRRWSQEWEVELATKIMHKAISLYPFCLPSLLSIGIVLLLSLFPLFFLCFHKEKTFHRHLCNL